MAAPRWATINIGRIVWNWITTEMEYPIITAFILVLAATVSALALFEHIGLPSLVAYLLVGAAVGPYGVAWFPHTADLHFLAEFGVALLLFTVGLEFSLARLWSLRRYVFGLGGLQVTVTGALAALVAGVILGLAPAGAFVLGGALAMSSTAVVTHQLTLRGELGQQHGRLAVAVLIFQDIAVVPFLILIPVLDGGGAAGVWRAVALALVQGIAVVAAMMLAGRWLLRPLLHRIATFGSGELFTLAVLCSPSRRHG